MRHTVTLSEKNPANIHHVVNEYVGIENGMYGAYVSLEGRMVFSPKGAAVKVLAVYTEIETGIKTLKLEFPDAAGRNITIDFSRKDLTETGILTLTEVGVQVSKQDAKTLIAVIQNQEVNAEQYLYHNRLGFFKYNSRTVFLGKKGIGVDSDYKGNIAIGEYGSYECWTNMVREEVLGNTALEFMLAVGASGVLCDYLQNDIAVENVIVHLIGDSSTGKTTAALLAVSEGCSPSFKGDSLVLTFADTQNALMSSFQSSYTALVDEGSLCRWNMTNFLYNASCGKEKRRLSKELNMSDSSYFRTAIVLTSEKSLLNMCDENSGLLVRNMEFDGIEWTKDADNSDRIKRVIQSNYGFLVPRIAQKLLSMEAEGEKDALIQNYWDWCERIVIDARENGQYTSLTERGAKQMALILVAAQLVSEELEVSLDMDGILGMLEKHSLVSDPNAADIGIRAYEYLMQYINKYYGNFISEDADGVYRDCKGRIQSARLFKFPDGKTSQRVLFIADSELESILRDGGFLDKRVVLKRLKALNLLKSEADRYLGDVIIQEGIKVKGYTIRLLDVYKPRPEKTAIKMKIASSETKTEEYADDDFELEFDDEEE